MLSLGAGLASLGHLQLPQDTVRHLQLALEVADHAEQGLLPNVHKLATVVGTAVFVRELVYSAK